MKKQSFTIRTQQILEQTIRLLSDHWEQMAAKGQPLHIEIKRTTRSIEQNKRYWSIIGMLSSQAVVHGQKYTADVWHEHCKRTFIGVTGLPSGLPMAVSSKSLTVDEFGDYLQQVEVLAVECGVVFPNGW